MEIAAANAIWKTLSTCLKNGKQLYEMGTQVSEYLSATQKVKEKAGDAASRGTALECFQYNEQLRIQRSQLEYFLKKSRLGGWSDFVKFEAEWHRQRKEEEQEEVRKRARRRKAIDRNITEALKAMGILVMVMGVAFGVAIYLTYY
tara:strand:- start:155 stop:592 length:438 start_codon:yes stop_codon:yes gene_type:complete